MRPLDAPYIAHESSWGRLTFVVTQMLGTLVGGMSVEPTATHEEIAVRGQSSEPVELRPGTNVREQARVAEIERWAWRRVRSMRAFFTHLTIFVGINFILFLVDSATPGHAWFYIPLMSWGLLLALHGLHAYDLLPWTTQGWEQRKVRELIITRLRAERDLKE
jgi:hypothetical protein